MICPVDLVQMHQKDKVGGGESTDEKYVTWEIKECPSCGRLVEEIYSATVIDKEELKKISEGIK